MNEKRAGYDARFVEPLLDRHKCPICLFVMRNPVQTECGHLFCRACMEPVLSGSHPICPIDKTAIKEVFPDNACKREIFSLQVYCDFATSGCNWKGPLKELETHTDACDHRDVQCRQCGQYIPFISFLAHQEECPMRTTACPYCKKDVPHSQMNAHIERVCTDYCRLCPQNCSDKKMTLSQIEAHLNPKTGDCPLAEIPCPYKPYGCTFISQRQLIGAHLNERQLYHIHLQADCFKNLKEHDEKYTAVMQQINDRILSLGTRMTSVERLGDALEQRIEVTSDQRGVKFHSDSGNWPIQNFSLTAPDQLTQIIAQVATLEKKVDDCVRRVPSEFEASSTIGTDLMVESMKQGLPQRLTVLEMKVAELEHGLDRCLSSCLDQELRLQLLERATYNGVLLWKIDDFERRRKEAVDGVTMSLYSVPFYTSRHGYKMCARVYLNGDGMGKGSHLSFFFVVMKGPFDALLPWPFKQKVTLTIINQAGKKHVTDTFRPDPQSSSFQRPTQKEMNVASGCPMFIRIEQLLSGGFIKDGCIFLRVIVDTSDLQQVGTFNQSADETIDRSFSQKLKSSIQ